MKRLRGFRLDPQGLREARESVLRAFALVVTDRRWAAPLSAMALGFGLFLGVAIGPGAAGSLATGPGSIIALAAGEGQGDTEGAEAEAEPSGFGEAEAEEPTEEAESFEPGFAEPALLPEPAPAALPEETAPPGEEPAPESGEEEDEAQQLKGTVVHANPVAGSYTLAITGGELVSVHAAKLPVPGERLTVQAEPLDNNTFAEDEREKTGAAARVSARGVVTYVDADPAAPAYTLSGRGSSILVHVPATPAPQLPGLGAYATVGVKFEAPPPQQPAPAEAPAPGACAPDPTLKPPPSPQRVAVQQTLKTEPEPATYVDLAGIVSAVCPATMQLLLSADDLRASEADLLVAVPDSIDTAKLKAGDPVVATANVDEAGALTLSGLAGDEGRKGAEDTALAVGDLKR